MFYCDRKDKPDPRYDSHCKYVHKLRFVIRDYKCGAGEDDQETVEE